MRKQLFICVMMGLCSLNAYSQTTDFTQYVNQYIGTGGHGHVFLGANVPFGLVQLGPTQGTYGWDRVSGYHYDDTKLYGFSHTHMSGTGCADLGDITFLPIIDEKQEKLKLLHENETVSPGYYALYIPETNVRAELTATIHCGMHRYSFPQRRIPMLRLDLELGVGNDHVDSVDMWQENETTIAGLRHSTNFMKGQHCYFVAKFSQPVRLEKKSEEIGIIKGSSFGRPLLMKVGLSAVSVENARMNLQKEIPGWDFDQVTKDAHDLWNKQLSKIVVTVDDDDATDTTVINRLNIFYTALYHSMIAPSVFSDVNGEYRGPDQIIYHGDKTTYTTFSLWDTYRAWHPLSTLIHPEMQSGMAETMLHIYQQQGRLPVWHLWGGEANCMVGNPSIPVLSDMMLKGFDVNKDLAIEAMKNSVGSHLKSYQALSKYGYVPIEADPENETVGKGMEYAIAYGCAYRATQDEYFKPLAESYQYYFDQKTGFMRARYLNGKWREPFDPTAPKVKGVRDYTEGNAWQYTWLVPHDVKGLVNLFGSEKRFTAKLDSLFLADSTLANGGVSDITGMIGQYAHGNEPSHHVIYLYNYIGQPWKGAPLLRRVMTTLYHNSPDGLCGNEDVGQMSAWFILSAMGFYQVEPAGGRYVLGTPLFKQVDMRVGDGKTFSIIAQNNSDENIYIQRAWLNGVKYTKSYIDFKDIQRGGTLVMEMGNHPSGFGKSKKDRP